MNNDKKIALTATFKRAVRNYQSVYSVATVDESEALVKLPEITENCMNGVCVMTWKPVRKSLNTAVGA